MEQNAYCQDSPGASPPEGAAASEVDQDQVRQLTEDLRSDQFTIRELASERIFVMGHTVLPMLRDCRRKSSDVEQIDRLDHIIEALAEQDLETRIHNFLKGGDADLDNWPEVEKWFGDSPRVRELFVDLYREHPYLVESLGGTPQQLSIGLSRVRRTLIERGVGAREMPQRIDLLALLLPMSEPNFDAGPQYDAIVVTILQSYQANDLRNDVAFSKPFMRMMAGWMTDSDINVREQVLRLALQWKMDIGLNLALETLKTNPDPILLCRCIQTISRQGNRDHLVLLSHYVNDPTVVFRGRYRGISSGEVQVGDVAAAAIAVLSSVPVTQIGFAEPAEHEVFGIIFEELVVPQKAIPEPDNGTEKEDASDGKKADQPDEQPAEFVPPGFGVQPRTIEEIQELRRQNERRAAARIEIHAKAMALVPEDDTRLPAQSPEAQSPEKS
ncbi:MAG: hypothetical protein KDB00_12890 [Planctomycetales bacterium]|nr:hypothetical protein [Planctomycetales bacterium]